MTISEFLCSNESKFEEGLKREILLVLFGLNINDCSIESFNILFGLENPSRSAVWNIILTDKNRDKLCRLVFEKNPTVINFLAMERSNFVKKGNKEAAASYDNAIEVLRYFALTNARYDDFVRIVMCGAKGYLDIVETLNDKDTYAELEKFSLMLSGTLAKNGKVPSGDEPDMDDYEVLQSMAEGTLNFHPRKKF